MEKTKRHGFLSKNEIRTKKSYGVAICRFNLDTNQYEMLLVKKLQDTFSVSEANHFEIEEMKDMTVLGQTGFNSFLKVLTSLNLPNIKINKEHCPTDFFSIFMTEKLNKERLITILVTPFTTCSARLPVYAIIIALVIPDERVFGIINMQGLTLMLLYLLGFGMAIFSAYMLNKILKIRGKTYFVVEMPNYKLPLFKNVFINVFNIYLSKIFNFN